MIISEDKIEELIIKNAGIVRSIASKLFIVGGSQDDLYQEGMIGLLQAIRTFNPANKKDIDSAFKSYAALCIKRRCYDAIKHANREKNKAMKDYISLDTSKVDETALMAEDPEEMLISEEDRVIKLRNIHLQLTAFEKLVLTKFLEGKKHKEIAKELDKNEKSIENTLQRIKQKVRTTA